MIDWSVICQSCLCDRPGMTTTETTITTLSEAEADAFVAEWMDAWNAHDLDRVLEHYADDVEYYSPFIAQMAEPGGPGADGRLTGKAAVRRYFAAALERNADLHFDPPAHVAVGAGSVSFVYTSIRNLTAVETLVFAPGTRTVARAHCHYRSPAARPRLPGGDAAPAR
jgi:ketosteroid isomerase-like protein